jgi:GntR family transcriptional regulator
MSKPTPLFVSVSPGDPRSMTRQIVDGIRMEIASGRLEVGAQLPSVRGLAEQLTVNPKTIAKAYEILAREGWLYSRQGLGLFVAAPRQRLSDAERSRRLDQALDAFGAEVIGLDYSLKHILERVRATLTPYLDKRTG